MTQPLGLKLYLLKLFIQVNVLLFYFFTFFKHTSALHKKNLSNQLCNFSSNFGFRIKKPEF